MPAWNHATLCLLLGLVLIGFYAWMWKAPGQADRVLRAFPRSVWPARILTVITLFWFGLNLREVDLGGFNPAKQALWVLVPAGMVLVIRYIPDLLAVRGLCALLLLAAKPVMNFARWHGTPASTALVILCYVLIVKAMFLMVYPHVWFRVLNRLRDCPSCRRRLLGVGMGVGAVLAVAGLLSLF